MQFGTLARIGLIALAVTSLLGSDINAQPLIGPLKASAVSLQDNASTGQDAQAIELLHTSIQSLSENAHRKRRIAGYALLGLGIGSGAGGAATLALGDTDNTRIVGYSLLGGAALFSGLSLIPFKVSSESERIYSEFDRMPESTSDQVRQKFSYGERRFEELAHKNRRGRFINGGVSIIVGITGLFLVGDSNQDRFNFGAWPIAGGVTQLLLKSDAERRYSTYQKAKEDLMAHTGDVKIRYGLALMPTGGLAGTVQVRF